jgi:hypothetical protein
MTFKTENELCLKCTEVILGIVVGENRQIVCVPEVPSGYFSNDYTDMLLLDIKNKEVFGIEYKLTDLTGLRSQLQRRCDFHTIGILNAKFFRTEFENVYPYTGEDSEIELIATAVLSKWQWTTIYRGKGMTYYWAYKDQESNLNGGLKGGNKQTKTFHHIYQKAIVNLQRYYKNNLDFMLVHSALHSGYTSAVSLKHYRMAMKLLKENDGKVFV